MYGRGNGYHALSTFKKETIMKNSLYAFCGACLLAATYYLTACSWFEDKDDGGDPTISSGYVCFTIDRQPQTVGIDVTVYGNICTKTAEGNEICRSESLTQITSDMPNCLRYRDAGQENIEVRWEAPEGQEAISCFDDGERSSVDLSNTVFVQIELTRNNNECSESGNQFYPDCEAYVYDMFTEQELTYLLENCRLGCANNFTNASALDICLANCQTENNDVREENLTQAELQAENLLNCCTDVDIANHQDDPRVCESVLGR
jgi:hypothetical protein